MPQPILQIEDDENDVLFLRIAMENAGVSHPLQVAKDGRQAIEYLSGTGKFSDRGSFPLPCLVLMDLKLPRLSGHEVLKWIRNQPNFRTLPVLVFTSSNADSDIETAYQLG